MRLSNDIAYHMINSVIQVETRRAYHTTSLHIAMIIKRGKVLSVASNAIGSRSRGCGYATRTIHAERAAIKKVGDISKLAGAIMVVIRIMRGTREVGPSEPCHACKCHLETCIRDHGLKRVYYSV